MTDNLKPYERAEYLVNQGVYFTGNKEKSKEFALFICQVVKDQKLKIDDRFYWELVVEEIYNT
jgi:hypothetical protein